MLEDGVPHPAADALAARLGIDAVREIDGVTLRIDDHSSPVCDAVWQLYRAALRQLGPVSTLIEWDCNIPELAVLKTIGFTNRSVLALVLAESMLLVVLGGAIGLVLASGAVSILAAKSNGMIQMDTVPAQTWMIGLGLMLVIGLVVGLLPAMRAMRLNIVDALAGR